MIFYKMEKLFINSEELSKRTGIPKRMATKIINQVNKELSDAGFLVVQAKSPIAPTDRVMERIGVKL